MRISSTLVALSALVPLVLSGCGNKELSSTSDFSTKDGASITLAAGSADVTQLPFYLDGTQSLTGKQVDPTQEFLATGTARSFTDFSQSTAFANYEISLAGEIRRGGDFDYYRLTITGGAPSAFNADPLDTYVIGVVREVNGTVLTFNALQYEGGLPPVFQPLANNRIEVWSWRTNVDGTSTGATYHDFSVNVPTVAGTEFAPYTGQPNASKLVVGTTNNDYILVRNEFDWTAGAPGTLSRRNATHPTNVTLPWRPSSRSSVPTTVNRDIRAGQSFPGAYWKAGYGFLEALAVVRDDNYRSSGVHAKADGTTVDASATPFIQTTYLEYTVNTPFSGVSGFYVADYVIPHVTN
jgi:hypothetical protein